jgi:cobalt/nickel transport system permease protein
VLLPLHAWVGFLLFFCCFLALSFLAQISLRVLFGRALISLIFSAAALPLLFTQAGPKILLFEISSWQVFVSQIGLSQFISILIKSGLSVIAAVIFTATTRFDEILIMLRSLGLPKELVAILGLMWRYLFILVDEAKCLLRARQSRSGAGVFTTPSIRTLPIRIGTTGKMAGNLLLRALDRGERIYAAMCSRGYLGEPLHAEKQTLTTADVAVILAGLIFIILIFAASRMNSF